MRIWPYHKLESQPCCLVLNYYWILLDPRVWMLGLLFTLYSFIVLSEQTQAMIFVFQDSSCEQFYCLRTKCVIICYICITLINKLYHFLLVGSWWRLINCCNWFMLMSVYPALKSWLHAHSFVINRIYW